MKLAKAKEILDLNIKEASKQMPPDTLQALKIASEGLNYILHLRAFSIQFRNQMLPSEKDIPDLAPSADRKQRLRESPLGRKPGS